MVRALFSDVPLCYGTAEPYSKFHNNPNQKIQYDVTNDAPRRVSVDPARTR